MPTRDINFTNSVSYPFLTQTPVTPPRPSPSFPTPIFHSTTSLCSAEKSCKTKIRGMIRNMTHFSWVKFNGNRLAQNSRCSKPIPRASTHLRRFTSFLREKKTVLLYLAHQANLQFSVEDEHFMIPVLMQGSYLVPFRFLDSGRDVMSQCGWFQLKPSRRKQRSSCCTIDDASTRIADDHLDSAVQHQQ
ncbi:hypothetical protein L2E82_19910 [Cichorium intybus]|uniref:Uncharacterized protein n=1 Tax=Cichorium intybus TaxID=13427 RepID=A0ACB9DRH5_CICIN|nr:hypothetical protein L2E82_19910 [Cichorium intybus]